MRIRIASLLLAMLLPAVAGAWVELGSYYQFGTTHVQLGDICDSTRYPLTPGDCSGNALNPDWRVEIEQAFSRWHTTTSNFTFTSDPGIGQTEPGVCSDGDPNSAFFMDTICDFDDFGGSTLAVALTSFFFDGVSLHSDVIFNTAWTWDAFDDGMSNHGDDIDFTRVAVHEFGHVAGLGHPYHDLAIMAPFIQESVISPQPDDVAGMSAVYGINRAITVEDLNNNGVQEFIAVRRTPLGATLVEVRDADTDAVISAITFLDPDFEPIDVILLGDEDGSGSVEIGVLAIRYSDQRSAVEIRNIQGNANTRRIWLPPDITPIQALNIGDADGNGVAEIAVLAIRELDLRAFVDIRNSFGPTAGRTIYLPDLQSPVEMKVFPDASEAGTPRLAVLMQRWTDLRYTVEMRNAIGAQAASRVFTNAVAAPTSMEIFNSASGYRIALLSTRYVDARTIIELSGVDGSARATRYLAAGNTPIEIRAIDDADNDGQQDLAVLSQRNSDGRIIIEVRNPDDTNRRVLYLSAGFEAPGSLMYLGDADGDTFEEIAVLLSRQTDARRRIDWRNAAGSNTAATSTVWLSP